MRRRVILDTSTLVSAAIRADSVPHRAWLYAQHACEILASAETAAELKSVLFRDRMARFVDEEIREELLFIFSEVAEWIEVPRSELQNMAPSCRDTKDNMFLALALTGKADLIVSSDQDLLVMNPWRGIPILTPAEFLAQAEKSELRGGESL